MLGNICDFICEIGLESLTNKIQNAKNTNEIKGQLQDFIEKKQELFENVNRDEEIDFQGIAEYISKQYSLSDSVTAGSAFLHISGISFLAALLSLFKSYEP